MIQNVQAGSRIQATSTTPPFFKKIKHHQECFHPLRQFQPDIPLLQYVA